LRKILDRWFPNRVAYHRHVPTITLIGPGAIGATLAAWLCQDARNIVTVAARTPFDAIELDSPHGTLRATPRVITDRAQAAHADWVLAVTKTYDSEAATQWFENGPGKVLVPSGRNGADFVALFEKTKVDAQVTDDFKTAVWKKLCLNSAGAVCAVLKEPSRIAHHDGVAYIMRAIVRECVAVGRAEGAKIEDSMPDDIVARTRKAPRDSTNSMLVDRLNNRKMEIDARNGVIVRLGRRHGIEAPMNALMVSMLEAAQDA
jgi:2-dehydropantoate 2-reductase